MKISGLSIIFTSKLGKTPVFYLKLEFAIKP